MFIAFYCLVGERSGLSFSFKPKYELVERIDGLESITSSPNVGVTTTLHGKHYQITHVHSHSCLKPGEPSGVTIFLEPYEGGYPLDIAIE